MQVPLLDLKPQYRSLKKELDEVLINIAGSQYFILGPVVDKMEKSFSEFLKAEYSLGVSSGTDALLIALMAIDIKPGDEVIVPTYSFFATAGVVSRLNAVPVFTDIDPVTYNIDPNDIEKRITSKTKAIIPVHLYGQSCEMDKIMEIARKHKLYVIEDAAQAISTQYKDGRCVGTIGDIGCFSFFPSKNLGCFGDAGLVTTNNKELADKLRLLRVHGGEQKYYHKMIGGNFRIDAIQSGVLNVKLPHLNKWSQKRRDNAALYKKLFIEAGLAETDGKINFDAKNKVLIPKAVYGDDKSLLNSHIYNQFIVRVENRDEMRKFLSKNNIANEIYYPIPFHLQECFASLGYKNGDFPVSENAAATSIALPVFPELTAEQITYVVETFRNFIRN